MSDLRRQRQSAALTGRRLTAEQRAALACPPGCTCGKHESRNRGQFRTGFVGFVGPHSAATRSRLAEAATTHGMSGTPTYRSWVSMWERCKNPSNASYGRYGGRGIRVCDRWKSFEAFFADMGERLPGLTLGRIDNDGNYEPSNCRWETKAQQEANKFNPWTDPEKAKRMLGNRQRRSK